MMREITVTAKERPNIRRTTKRGLSQVLFRLDNVQTRAELSIIRSQLAEHLGRGARLIAERDGLATIAFSPKMASFSEDPSEIIGGETRLFDGNRTNRESRKEQLEIGIVQLGEEVKGLESRQVAKSEELRLVEMERTKFLGLFQKGYIDGTKVFNINREWARLLGERGEIDAALARAKLRISETRLQIISIDDTARTEAQRELRLVEAKHGHRAGTERPRQQPAARAGRKRRVLPVDKTRDWNRPA